MNDLNQKTIEVLQEKSSIAAAMACLESFSEMQHTVSLPCDPWWPDTDTEKMPIGPTDI